MLIPILLSSLAFGGDNDDAPLLVRSYDISSALPFQNRSAPYAALFPHLFHVEAADEIHECHDGQPEIILDQIQRLWGDELFQNPGRSVRLEERQLVVRAPEALHGSILELLQFFESVMAPTTGLTVDVVTLTAPPAAVIPSVLGAADAEKLLTSLAQIGKRTTMQLELRAGSAGTLDLTTAQELVVDYNCEIAQAAAILDPVIETVRTGLRLDVRCAPAPGGTWLALILRSSEPVGAVREIPLDYRSMIVAQERDLGEPLAHGIQSICLENRSIALNTFLGEGKALVVQTSIDLQQQKGSVIFVLRAKGKPLPRELRFVPAAAGAEREIVALAWPFAMPPRCRLESEDALLSASRSSSHPGAFTLHGMANAMVAGFSQPSSDGLFELLRCEDPGRVLTEWGPWLLLSREPGYDPPSLQFEKPDVILARVSPSPRLFQLAFTLKRGGPQGAVVARIVAPARAAEPLLAVLGTEENRVWDFDVEVAQNAAVADPLVYDAFDGLALSATPGTTVRGELTVALRAKAHIQRGPTREFRQETGLLGDLAQSSADILAIDEKLVFAKDGGARVIALGDPSGGSGPGALVLEIEMSEVR